MGRSDVVQVSSEVIELFLSFGIFLGHFFVLRLPLVAFLLKGLYFAFEVSGFDVGLAKSKSVSAMTVQQCSA
jgi:hypothetical protein